MTAATNEATQADAVVLTALAEEAEPFAELLDDVEIIQSRRRYYMVGTLDGGTRVVVSTANDMGNASSSYATRDAIIKWNPQLIILAGITGGIAAADVRIGDVLAPEQIVGYEHAKIKPNQTQTRFEAYRPSHQFLEILHAIASEKGFWKKNLDWSLVAGIPIELPPHILFGVIGSGEKVIAAEEWSDQFREKWPKAIGVEMESAGFALASYRSDEAPKFGVIKGVSDMANVAKDDRYRRFAAKNSAAVTVEVIRRFFAGQRETQQHQPPLVRERPQHVDSPLSKHAPEAEKQLWGKRRVRLCRKLDKHLLLEIADFAGIRPHIYRHFPADPSEWCRPIWDYLENQDLLSELFRILADDLERPDLALIVDGPLD
jgi:nucleoside phosphorylase